MIEDLPRVKRDRRAIRSEYGGAGTENESDTEGQGKRVPHMILSAGVVVVRREKDEWKYLFLRAYRNWDFPKGLVEPEEDPLETAKREVSEETGLTDLTFTWGHAFKETLPYYSGGKKIARYYIAETSESNVTFSVNPEIGKPEHHEYRWLSSEEIKKKAPERLAVIVEWAKTTISLTV